MSGILFNCSSTSFIEARSLNQTQSSPAWLILLPAYSRDPLSQSPLAGPIGRLPGQPSIYAVL